MPFKNAWGDNGIGPKYIWKGLGSVVAGFAILLVAFGSWVIIPAGHRGVLMTFGKVQSKILTPGLNFKIPLIQSVFKYNVQMRMSEFKGMAAASQDMQTVRSAVVINWTTNPESVGALYEGFGDWNEMSNSVLDPAVNQSFKDVTARYKVDQILANREKLREEFQSLLEAKMKEYPIKIVAASVVDISFSAEYEKAIESKQVAEQESKRAVYKAIEAENMAKAKVNEARGEAEANRLKAQTVTNKVLQLEWINKWNGALPQVVTGSGGGLMLNMADLQKQ